MKKGSMYVIALLISFFLYCHGLFSMQINYKHIFNRLYSQVKAYCNTPRPSQLSHLSKAGVNKILVSFLSACPVEPDLGFVKKALQECPDQNIVAALDCCGKKAFWSIAEYLYDNYPLTEDDKIRLLYNTARFGAFYFFKKIILQDLFFDKDAKKIKPVNMSYFISRKGKFLLNVSLSECLMRHLIEWSGDKKVAHLLLSLKGDFNKALLFKAIKEGHFKLIALFMRGFAPLRCQVIQNKLIDERGHNALHYAVASKKDTCKLVCLFLKCGVKPDVQAENGYTPLELLLLSGKDFNQEDITVVDAILSQEGYYANEVNVDFIRDHNPIGDCLGVMLDKIEQRQKKSTNKKYTLSNLIWNNNEVTSSQVKALLFQEKEQNYQRAFMFAVQKRNLDLVRYFLDIHEQILDDELLQKAIKTAICQRYGTIAYEIINRHSINKKTFAPKVWKNFFCYAALHNNVMFIDHFMGTCGITGIMSCSEMSFGEFAGMVLIQAACKGHKEIICYMSKYDTFSPQELEKALFLAIGAGHVQVVDFIAGKYFTHQAIIEKSDLDKILYRKAGVRRCDEKMIDIFIKRDMILWSNYCLEFDDGQDDLEDSLDSSFEVKELIKKLASQDVGVCDNDSKNYNLAEDMRRMVSRLKVRLRSREGLFEKKKHPKSIMKTKKSPRKSVTFEDDDRRLRICEKFAAYKNTRESESEHDSCHSYTTDSDDDIKDFFEICRQNGVNGVE